MMLAWWVNALALLVATLWGVRAFFDPKWAARLSRLQPDAQGGGFAEFRATYGGVTAGAHGAALILTLVWIYTEEYVLGSLAVGASAVMSAAWLAAACGRIVSMYVDGTRTGWNQVAAALELLGALAIGAPWLVWVLT